jgi:hypothetical protein
LVLYVFRKTCTYNDGMLPSFSAQKTKSGLEITPVNGDTTLEALTEQQKVTPTPATPNAPAGQGIETGIRSGQIGLPEAQTER